MRLKLKLVIKFQHHRLGCRDIELQHLIFRKLCKQLKKSTKGVSMGGNKRPFPQLQARQELLIPKGLHSHDRVRKALGERYI